MKASVKPICVSLGVIPRSLRGKGNVKPQAVVISNVQAGK